MPHFEYLWSCYVFFFFKFQIKKFKKFKSWNLNLNLKCLCEISKLSFFLFQNWKCLKIEIFRNKILIVYSPIWRNLLSKHDLETISYDVIRVTQWGGLITLSCKQSHSYPIISIIIVSRSCFDYEFPHIGLYTTDV